MAQSTGELSVYQARLQDWFEDTAFWTDISAHVSDWSQELYGDVRNYAVPGAALAARRDALNEYLQHELALARVGPDAAAAARSFLERAYSPLANAAWTWDAAFGWTAVPVDLMKHYTSSQVYALRHSSAQAEQDHAGFAWAPKNLNAVDATTFASETSELLDRLAAAIRDSGAPVDPADPGVGACGSLAQNLWCAGDLDGAWLNEGWKTFATWKPSVLAFAGAPQSIPAGTVSAPVVVELRTHTGIPLSAQPLASDTDVELANRLVLDERLWSLDILVDGGDRGGRGAARLPLPRHDGRRARHHGDGRRQDERVGDADGDGQCARDLGHVFAAEARAACDRLARKRRWESRWGAWACRRRSRGTASRMRRAAARPTRTAA